VYYDTIHIGEKIKSVFNQSGLNIAQFARLLQVRRTRIYAIFNSKTLDIGLLCKISDVLHYDFIMEIYLNKREDEKQNPSIINIQFQLTSENLSDFIKSINRLKKAGIIV
jgi:transcriptional regulator with XRE-family HTH domain